MLSTPRSPWQRAYIERVIGSIRRECIDHVIVFNEAGLYRYLKSFMELRNSGLTNLLKEATLGSIGAGKRSYPVGREGRKWQTSHEWFIGVYTRASTILFGLLRGESWQPDAILFRLWCC